MTKQAPLPWKLMQNSWQYTTIYDAEDNHVCRLDLEDWSVTKGICRALLQDAHQRGVPSAISAGESK